MPIARALTWTCFAFVVSWQTSMPWIHACAITSSIVYRWRGSGSSILRMRLRHARGLRLLIVGGHDDTVGFGFAHACAYDEYSGSFDGCAARHGSSWKCRQ